MEKVVIIIKIFSALLLILLNLSCIDGENYKEDTLLDVRNFKDEAVFIDYVDLGDLDEIGDTNMIQDIVDESLFDEDTSPDAGYQNILNISFILQLENRDILDNKALFESYIKSVDEIAGIFEKYKAKISLEAKEIVLASVRYNSKFLNDLKDRGHSINIHADSGTKYGMTFSDFVQELREKKEEMEGLSIEPLGVSGVCSHLDWVSASFNVGFKYITSITAFCLKSLPLEQQPDFVKNCLAPTDCQQAYPFEFEKRLSLWRARLGSDWRIDYQDGLMVLFPSFSRLSCLDEEYKNPEKNFYNCTFDNFDIERSLDIIDNAIKKFDKDRINVIIFIWNFGYEIEKTLLEKWLSKVDYYVRTNKVRWRTTDEIFGEFSN